MHAVIRDVGLDEALHGIIAMAEGNDRRRPAWVVLTEEWPFGPCPERGLRIVNVEQEITPMLVGTIAQADSVVENCLAQPSAKRPLPQ